MSKSQLKPFRCLRCASDHKEANLFHAEQTSNGDRPPCPICSQEDKVIRLVMIHLIVAKDGGQHNSTHDFACENASGIHAQGRPLQFTPEPTAATCKDCLDHFQELMESGTDEGIE